MSFLQTFVLVFMREREREREWGGGHKAAEWALLQLFLWPMRAIKRRRKDCNQMLKSAKDLNLHQQQNLVSVLFQPS
jgi:hypothetical protein